MPIPTFDEISNTETDIVSNDNVPASEDLDSGLSLWSFSSLKDRANEAKAKLA